MKKLLASTTFCLLATSAFALANATIKAQWYKTTCANGSVYYFQADNLTTAQHIGSILCSTSGN
ncbi:hypothetical protein ABGT15_06460 [Flavobacterium enshiense]|uniref:hypothetical protein n=1 Tax=Flavobacterium enshiense TaxID=1341165 RepID=UPI00345CAE96